MGKRTDPIRISLSPEDDAIAKGMLLHGDRQHDIAAWFGLNGARIAQAASGECFGQVAAATADLPPPGPYPNGRQTVETKEAPDKALAALAEAETALQVVTRKKT